MKRRRFSTEFQGKSGQKINIFDNFSVFAYTVSCRHEELTPDNNAAERGIRPFVMGRKNFVICGSPEGAKNSCALYSLIETAKANNLNPFNYLKTVFEKIPTLTAADDWEQLLPWNFAT